jgi:hypothetical protein
MPARKHAEGCGPDITVHDFTSRIAEIVSVESILNCIAAPNLRKMAAWAVRDLAKAFAECESDITDALTGMQEAKDDDDESDLKIKLGFGITWNLDRATVDTCLGWSVKKKCEASHRLNDENQPPLPGMDE